MRVACITLPGPGHGFPMLAVGAELVRRGHDVLFVSGAKHAGDAPTAGVSFEILPSVQGSPLHQLRPYDDAAAQAEALLPILHRFAPDISVVDVITVAGALASDMARVPYATLVVHPLHTPSRSLPPFGYGRRPARWPPLTWLRDGWMRHNNRKDLERARAEMNRNRVALGLPPSDALDVGLSERLVLVATLPALEIPRPDWPPQAHVIGPCLWDYPGSAEFEPPEGVGPLVLIAPSTAYGGDRMLSPSIAAVASLGARAVVTAGAAALPEALPPGVVAAPGVAHAAVLPYAAAAVANGGHGTVLRILSAGVPMAVVAGHGDQQENAYRVGRAGAGIQVRFPSHRSVARALGRILADPRYARSAARIAGEASRLDGPGRAADLIERRLSAGAETTEGGPAPAPLPNGGL